MADEPAHPPVTDPDNVPENLCDGQINVEMELRLSARRAIADLSRMVDELSRTVDEKEAALRRAELMAKEIDHRVMNSLQLVSGLLDMQSRGVGSSETAEQLALASNIRNTSPSREMAGGTIHNFGTLELAAGHRRAGGTARPADSRTSAGRPLSR